MKKIKTKAVRTPILEHPHKIELDLTKRPDAVKWCEEQFGPMWRYGINDQGVWVCALSVWTYHYVWSFAHEKDAMMFILRWA